MQSNELAVIYDDRHLKHSPHTRHVERPERTYYVKKFLEEKSFFNDVKLFAAIEASEQDILKIHTKDHVEYVADSIAAGKLYLDSDTYIVKDSLLPALLSAGAAIQAVDLVMTNSFESVFSLMRPPGHHAETTRSMGFCIFNNAAVASQYAFDKYNLDRIAVIDWDVHHGNGTQEIFYERPDLYFISLHQFPLYPGTGIKEERGTKEGKGFTLNFPLAPGTGGSKYIDIFENEIVKELENYKPQLLFISAGFDAHRDDPLADMMLTEDDYSVLTIIVKEFCRDHNIPVISLLEGGYNLEALAKSVYAHLRALNKK